MPKEKPHEGYFPQGVWQSFLDLSARGQGGTSREKRSYLEATITELNVARRFYLDFFLNRDEKLLERIEVLSKKTNEVLPALISTNKLITWAEGQIVGIDAHLDPRWSFSQHVPDFPNRYRRSVMKGCPSKARGQPASPQGLAAAQQDQRPTGQTYRKQSLNAFGRRYGT